MEDAKLQIEKNEKFVIEEKEDWVETLTCGWIVQDREFQMSMNLSTEVSREVVTIKEEAAFLCKCYLTPRCRSFKGTIQT